MIIYYSTRKELGYEPINWDRWDTIPYFLPFQYLVKLLPSGKGRRIVERDKLGRITASIVV